MSKNLIFVINCHSPYIRIPLGEGEISAQNELLFTSISNVYLPLLNLFENLKKDSVPFKIAMVFSAPLCTMLEDSLIQEQYIDFLDKKIALGNSEIERTKKDEKLNFLARLELERTKKCKSDFEKYEKRLVPQFSSLAKEGLIELLATCATYTFLPHYSDNTEILNAQVEAGLIAHQHFFGKKPEGFWLPENGYCVGLEKVLRSYGVGYTVLSAQGILFTKESAKNGIFTPVRTTNILGVFALDSTFSSYIEKISEKPVYKDMSSDIGYDLPIEDLRTVFDYGTPRFSTGYKYWSNGEDGDDDRVVYEPEKAAEESKNDALEFLREKNEVLSKAEKLIDSENVNLICAIEPGILHLQWFELFSWLENVIRENEKMTAAGESSIELKSFSDVLGNIFNLQRLQPVTSAASGLGYGEDLLDSSNDYMVPYLQKASSRMIDISDRFPNETGLKVRLLNLGAKELMLAQSSEWAMMLHKKICPEFVADQFKYFIDAFTEVFDALGTNQVSTEWLTKIEIEHPIFPWMNFRFFSKKK